MEERTFFVKGKDEKDGALSTLSTEPLVCC